MYYQPKVGFRRNYVLPEFEMPGFGDYNYTPPPKNEVVPDPIPSEDTGGEDTTTGIGDYTQEQVDNRLELADPENVYGPSFNPFTLMSMFNPAVGVAQGLTETGVPTTGYGSPGSVSSLTGGVFDDKGRSIDPITGYANPEYASKRAFYDYFMQDPLGNTFGDVDNQYDYSQNITGPMSAGSTNQNMAQAYEYGLENSPALQDEKITPYDLAVDIGMSHGIPEHSIDFGSPTHHGISGAGYTDTGAAPAGSQFSGTGTFSTSHSNTYDPTPEDYNESPDDSNSGMDASSGVDSSSGAGWTSIGGHIRPKHLNQGGQIQAGGK